MKHFKDMVYYCSSGHSFTKMTKDAFDKTLVDIYYSKLSIIEDNQKDRNHHEHGRAELIQEQLW